MGQKPEASQPGTYLPPLGFMRQQWLNGVTSDASILRRETREEGPPGTELTWEEVVLLASQSRDQAAVQPHRQSLAVARVLRATGLWFAFWLNVVPLAAGLWLGVWTDSFWPLNVGRVVLIAVVLMYVMFLLQAVIYAPFHRLVLWLWSPLTQDSGPGPKEG